MVGTGYVGLVSGTCFAEFGANVTCIDIDQSKIDDLNSGKIPIYEPGLDELVDNNRKEGRLAFTSEYTTVVKDADIVFIAVGTPSRHGDGHADLTYVYQAAEDIAPHLTGYTVIVDKSTVPVGTARNVNKIIGAANPDADFDVASNPEFLREGAAISDFMRPDRVVIGVESERAENILKELYRPLNLIEASILITNLESAELIKYASNAFLATKISFINEITIGRGDLSRSINKEVDDPEVSHLCETIVKAARKENIKVSIGGAINPQNANRIFKEIGPDKINTRSVVFNKESSKNIKQSVLKALEFEIIMMKENLRMGFVPTNEAEYRIEKLKERMHKAAKTATK